ncbi:hypothetical protein DDQ50_12825 [Amnibacterium flavum]|uniref:ATP-grasp domain-containing protein n=2 Tax=Amnibacterium flavum TaxID=2173173 RepID=A0A2V1HVB7_9MICO|nr:hypothetical protein DDQ50_12825 [Amnibacterium flavum]
MLRDHRPLLVVFADKAAVREYVADRVGEAFLPTAYAILDDPGGLVDLDLPESYVVKPTHGSGACIVVSPGAPFDAELPEARWSWMYRHVRPRPGLLGDLAPIAANWTTKLYGQGPNREWAYGRVRPRILVEEMLAGPNGEIPADSKLFVFHGTCRYIQVDQSRFGARTQDFFTPAWEHLPLSGGPAWADPVPARPERLAEMIAVAETLGAETDFVRVDLYDVGGRIVFGELTSYPAGGDSPFSPDSYDIEFGSHWTVPRRYR